ncbi:MAG: hypothetical protein OEW11_09675 [Nitrospirota bacterium]|nr:hypothetical protein [Nitrospirota bacterium]
MRAIDLTRVRDANLDMLGWLFIRSGLREQTGVTFERFVSEPHLYEGAARHLLNLRRRESARQAT